MGTNWTAQDVERILGRGTSAPSSTSGNGGVWTAEEVNKRLSGPWTAEEVNKRLNSTPTRTKVKADTSAPAVETSKATSEPSLAETPTVEKAKVEPFNPREKKIPTLTATSSGGRNYASQMVAQAKEQKEQDEKSAQLAEMEKLSAMTDEELENYYTQAKSQSENNSFLKRVFTGQGKSDFDAYSLASNERNKRLDAKNNVVLTQNTDVADKVKTLYDYFQTDKAIAVDTGAEGEVERYFADDVISGNRQIVELLQNPATVGEAYRVANSLGYGGQDIETLRNMGSDYLAVADVYQSLKNMGYDPSSLVKTYDRNQNAVQDAETAQYATEHGVKASLESIPQNVASGIGGSLATLDSWLMGKPLDAESNAFDYTRKVQTTRGQVGENIRTNEQGEETVLGKVGGFLYDAGMGMADSAANMALAGGNPIAMGALMGTQAGASSAYDVASRGGTVNQMAASGVASALAESITEAISLGNLKSLKNVAKSGGKGLLEAMGKQALVEGTEEGASEILNKAADYLINKDLSATEIQYRQYLSEGMSEEEARNRVNNEIFADIMKSIGMGAVSGGVFGAGANIVGNATNTNTPSNAQTIPVLEKAQNIAEANDADNLSPVKESETETDPKASGDTDESLVDEADVDTHTPEQIQEIESYKSAVDPVVEKFFAESNDNEVEYVKDINMGKMRDAVADYVEAQTGIKTHGNDIVFARNAARHIKKEHMAKGNGKSQITSDDVARIRWVLENADEIAMSKGTSRTGKSKDGTFTPHLVMRKRIDGHYYVIETVSDGKKHRNLIVDAFIQEVGSETGDIRNIFSNPYRVPNADNGPARTSDTAHELGFNQSISYSNQTVNSTGSQDRGGVPVLEQKAQETREIPTLRETALEKAQNENDGVLESNTAEVQAEVETPEITQYSTKKIAADDGVNKELSKYVGMYGTAEVKTMYQQLNAKVNEYIETGNMDSFGDAVMLAEQMDSLMEGRTYTYKRQKKNSVKSQNRQTTATYPSGAMLDILMSYQKSIYDAKNARLREKAYAPGETKVSQFRTNTVENSGIATEEENRMYAPKEDFTYETVSEKKSMERAQYSLNNVRDYIPNMMASEQGSFEGSDIDAFMLEYQRAMENARANNDVQGYEYASSLLRKVRSESTKNAQALQALAKWSRNTPEGQLLDVMNAVDAKVEKAVGKKTLDKAKEKVNKIADKAQALDIASDYEKALQQLRETCQSELGTDWQAVFDDIIANTENISYTSVIDILKGHGKLSKTIADYLDNSTKMQSAVLDYLYEIQENGYDMDSREARIIMAKAGKVIAKAIPSSVSSMVKQTLYNNMLGSFRTIVSRNMFGNMGFALMEQVRQPLAAAIDKSVAKKTGYRTTTGWSKEKQGAYVQGALRGFKEEISDFKLSIEQYKNGETSGLHTSRTGENTLMQAVKNNTSAFNGDLGDGRIGQVLTASNNLLAKVFNMSNDLIQHGMRGGDRIFYEATKDQSTTELKRLLKENYKINTDEMNMDEYIDAASTLIALEAVYQNDTLLSNAFTNMKKALADVSTDIVGVDLITQSAMPFVKTPSNIIEKAVQYSPLGLVRNALITKREKSLGEFNQRRYVDELSRNVVGTLLLIGAVCAVSQGLVTGAYDEDKDVKNAQKEAGMQEYALRLGNMQMDIGYIPVLGSTIEAGAAAKSAYDKARSENTGFLGSVGKGTAAAMGQTVQSIFDQSMLSSLSDLLSGSGYSSDKTLIQNAGEVALGLIGQMTPALTRQFAQSTDKYQRYAGEYGTAENNLNYLVMNNIPVLRQTQEIKYGNDGQPILQNDGRSAVSRFVENMILPGKITQERSTALYAEATRLYDKTGLNTAYLPTSKMSDIRTDAYEPTTAEFTEYKRIRGLYSADAGEALISSEYYGKLSDEDKAEALADIYAVMKQLAKEETVPDYTITSSTKECAIYKEQGIDGLISYMQYKHLLSEDEDTTTANMISRLQETYDTDEERGAALYYSKSQLAESAVKALEDKGYDGLYDYYKYMAQADPKNSRPTREETIVFLNTQAWMPRSTKAYWFDLMSSSTNNPYR